DGTTLRIPDGIDRFRPESARLRAAERALLERSRELETLLHPPAVRWRGPGEEARLGAGEGVQVVDELHEQRVPPAVLGRVEGHGTRVECGHSLRARVLSRRTSPLLQLGEHGLVNGEFVHEL